MDPRLYSKTVIGQSGKSVEVRRFMSERIDKAVSDALRRAKKKSVSLDVEFEEGDIRGVVAAKLDDQWSVALVGERKKTGQLTGGARVVFEW